MESIPHPYHYNNKDYLAEKFQEIADACMFTLRVEIRVHCIFHLKKMLKESNYFMENP